MLRGINRQDIFEDDGDYRQMTGCLRSLTERYDEMITRTVPMILKNGGKIVMRTNTDFEAPVGAILDITHGEIIGSNNF